MGLSYKMEGLFYLRKHLGTRTKSAKCPKSSPSLQSTSSPLTPTQTKKTFPCPHSLPLSLPSWKNPPTLQPPYSSTRTFHLHNLTPFTFQTSSATLTVHQMPTPTQIRPCGLGQRPFQQLHLPMRQNPQKRRGFRTRSLRHRILRYLWRRRRQSKRGMLKPYAQLCPLPYLTHFLIDSTSFYDSLVYYK